MVPFASTICGSRTCDVGSCSRGSSRGRSSEAVPPQEATKPPTGARTLAESHHVKLEYPEIPVPGTPFKVSTAWKYTRHTDKGDQSHAVEEVP